MKWIVLRSELAYKFFFILLLLAFCDGIKAQESNKKYIGSVYELDKKLKELIPENTKIEVIAEGFKLSEGPLWVRDGSYLLFSDILGNTIYKWHPEEGISVFLRPAGYAIGKDFGGQEAGTNGLFIHPVTKKILICEHGNRCLSELQPDNWYKKIVVDSYKGKRFNSPNDVVISSKGHLYFTDPPFGLSRVDGSYDKNPLKELAFNGVYHLDPQGNLNLVTKAISRPNGIALSPDERKLYVANADKNAIWTIFNVDEKGGTSYDRILFDASEFHKAGKKGSCDGMAIDTEGNIWATGPGGLYILTPEGKHIGSIDVGSRITNCTFGGEEGNELFMTADQYVLKMKVNAKGIGY